VRFRDFFFADVITSITHPLVDIGITFAYFTQNKWLTRDKNVAMTPSLYGYIFAFAYLPFWWRYW